jgi:K+-transporting ATPase KdpF subunit
MPASAKDSNQPHTMENIIVGVVAFLLFIYLFVAMIRPEKF